MQPKQSKVPDSSTACLAEEVSIRQLIAHGKSKTAVDRAKDLHKSVASSATEALLLDAYASRIQALLDQNLTLEAKSLLELVCARYPAAKLRLTALSATSSARAGALEELLAPLADPALSLENRAAIEQAVQSGIADLAAIADCAALPADHSLRVAAAAIERAFAAATSGPVTEEQIALPEVSHRSPLGPWKLLVRAIAHFYRGEDDACRECLAIIKPESVPARLVPAMRTMLGAKPAAPLTPLQAELVSRTIDNASALRGELEKLDQIFAGRAHEGQIFNSVRSAMQECRRSAPERVETLKRLIWARGAEKDLDSERMIAALQGPPRKDATFLRTLAHRMETTSDAEDLVLACGIWEEFRQEAVGEGWFGAEGVEVATLYVHMAGLLRRIPDDMLEELQQDSLSKRKWWQEEPYFLFPQKLYQRACLLDPHPQNFSQWLKWADGESEQQADAVAKAWHKVRPMDIEPLLHLMRRAEGKGAYPSALTYLEKAEAIDAVHSAVRAARLRLLAGSALRHLQQKKPHLAAEKLKAMAALPQSSQGDRPAFLAALSYIIAHNRNDTAAMREARAESARLLQSDIAGGLLALGIAAAAKCPLKELPLPKELRPEDRSALPVSVARVAAISRDLGIAEFIIPFEYMDEAARQFPRVRESLDAGQLLTLAEVALALDRPEFAYAASGEGLKRAGRTQARFLISRARSLPKDEGERHSVCAAAAAEFARQHQDADSIGEAVELVRDVFGPDSFRLTLDQAEEVVRKEIAASTYPSGDSSGPDYSALLPDELCDCPSCRRKRGEIPGPFAFDDDDEDEEEDDDDDDEMEQIFNSRVPAGMPPEIAQAMYQLMREAYLNGMSPNELLAELKKLEREAVGSSGKGKKGKGKRK